MSDMPDICGVWHLQSCYLKNLETDERTEPFGARPRGVIILLPYGRMAAIITPGEQKRPETEADQAEAFRKLVAYSGLYHLEPPDRFVTRSMSPGSSPGSVHSRRADLRCAARPSM